MFKKKFMKQKYLRIEFESRRHPEIFSSINLAVAEIESLRKHKHNRSILNLATLLLKLKGCMTADEMLSGKEKCCLQMKMSHNAVIIFIGSDLQGEELNCFGVK